MPQITSGTSQTGTLCYRTPRGRFYLGLSEQVLRSRALRNLRGGVQLIFTSPPFPLNRKKRYGNLRGPQYAAWLAGFAHLFAEFLAPDGSVVLELGNAWNPAYPTISTLPMEALLEFKRAGNFHLCQEFIYFNPARLPSPAEWVTVQRIRLKDAFTRLWWLSLSPRPKADNRRVLVEYSRDMRKLLESGKYNWGRRPSEHVIGEKSFLRDNGGAVPPNVLIAANTAANDPYLEYCREHRLQPHPSRMPAQIASFFVRFLTDTDDWVMDPFAGSNVTGAVAEGLGRRWISIEASAEYARGSVARFTKAGMRVKAFKVGLGAEQNE